MPEVDLSTLSGPELRSLLDSARARGQATLSYAILQEMADRRAGRFKTPRVVTLDLGDPLTPREPHGLAMPAQVADEPPLFLAPPPARRRRAKAEPVEEAPLHLAPPPAARPRRRKKVAQPPPEPAGASVWDDVPAAGPLLKLEGLPHPGRPGFARAAVFAAGLLLGAGAGFGAASLDLSRLAPAQVAEPPADLVKTAHQALPRAAGVQPNAPPAQIQVVEVPPADEPVAADFRETPLPDVEPTPETPPEPAHEVAQAAPPPPAPTPETPKITVVKREPRETPETPKITVVKRETPEISPACAAKRTPADRTICADPQLRRLQRELRVAYGQALEVHEDRDTLRQRQLAWRDARNTVDDADRLADLYAARIRKLHAAAEAARDGR